MGKNTDLRCDACGQIASTDHISRRLQRLAWATRYRPIHIGTLFLGAAAPADDSEFLYAPNTALAGEAARLLQAAGITGAAKSPETLLVEFQRGGFFLVYALECAPGGGIADVQGLLAGRVKSVSARIRRSLKPKRLAPISRELQPILHSLTSADLGCAVVLDDGKPFDLTSETTAARLKETLAAAAAAR